MKKIVLALLAAGLAAGMLAGCGSDDTNSTTSIASETGSQTISSELASGSEAASDVSSDVPESSTPSVPGTAVSSAPSSSAASKPTSSATASQPPVTSSKPSGQTSSAAAVSAKTPQEICKAVASAYGDNYYPNMEMPQEQIYGNFPIDKTLVESVYGEMPQISVNPDQLIVMKAAAGKGAQLESAMKTARDKYVSEARVYPKDMAKLEASRVVRSGDYVAFIMLGATDEVNEDETTAAAQKFAQDQIAIGVRAFQNAVK